MTCTPSPFPEHALAEATLLSPNRITVTDGICGDASHQAQGAASDHNPRPPSIIPHAFDTTQDALHFNAHAYGDRLAAAHVAGNLVLRALIKYFVSHNYANGSAKIFDPNVGRPYWRDMGGDNHASHLHTSFLYTPFAENYVGAFWGLAAGPAVYVDSEDNMIVCEWKKSSVPGREACAVLDKVNKVVWLHNGAALAYDQPTHDPNLRVWHIGATHDHPAGLPLNGAILGLGPLLSAGKTVGAVVLTSDHGTFKGTFT